jgi:SAM-dependent methyltransferase
MGKTLSTTCPFCKGNSSFVYKMKDYSIYKCQACGTGQVFPMPTDGLLKKFYDGFLFSANVKNTGPVLRSAKLLFPFVGLKPGRQLEMLDVGGGGGFYSKAFEDLGYGNSTYIDIDQQSCSFASKLGLKNVIHGDAILTDYNNKKFDFVMCRHLIEHLKNPAAFILNILKLLSKNGILLLVCPNGNSLEYLAHPETNIKDRITIISESNNLKKLRIIYQMLSGNMLHGIDPPRHLWAITEKGIKLLLNNKGYKINITTFPLSDKAFSPYYAPSSLLEKFFCLAGTYAASKICGGTHLSAIIKQV